MTKVEAIVVRDRVETVVDAARTGHESGDRICWVSEISHVTHNRTGKQLEEVEVV